MTYRGNVADSGLVRGRMYLLLHFCTSAKDKASSPPHIHTTHSKDHSNPQHGSDHEWRWSLMLRRCFFS